ncbi:MAG: ATP-binding cassette domain-containing protein [Myxococcales bacterium]|nr:ATP-binding cassette domain-containing protein [Myxococcales bacterium]MCB9671052.1 ATP-binding cassette domain-containing protein [Alphaproteobacteria bacterium]MCB9692307.1 ATP-binding cassette domain-containing protein [Alphaproteobacteria bacterium]
MIQVEQLSKTYGPARAIEKLSFEVEKGEIVGFLGPNGAGKSTTMRILAGALGATSGRARIGGIDVFEQPKRVKAMVGYLPERPPLYTEMTVRAFLRFCAHIKGAKDPARAVERSIERVGLKEVANRYIDHLSKGYRQRVGIAQAIVHDPAVLILDEPASGLDPAQRVEIRKLVRELAEGATTVILSTHVLPEVEAICGRVIIIDRGVIRKVAPVDSLTSATGVSLEVQRPSQALLDALAAVDGVTEVADRGGGHVELACARDVREEVARVAVDAGLLRMGPTGGLEDVFLRLTGHEGEA